LMTDVDDVDDLDDLDALIETSRKFLSFLEAVIGFDPSN